MNLPLTVTRADLLKFRDYFSGLLAYVQKGIASGRSGGRDREGRERAGIRRLRGQPRRHDPGGLRRAHGEGMRSSALCCSIMAQHRCRAGTRSGTAPSRARGDALRKRGADSAGARACLPRATTARARPTWQTVGAREPVIASLAHARIDPRTDRRRRYRAGARGHRPSSAPRLHQISSSAPPMRAAPHGAFDCATTLYRRAREAAGRSAAADEAAIGLAATLEQAGKPREALETYRELQLTFREAAAFDARRCRRRAASRPGSATPSRSPKPTTTSSSIASPASRHSAAPSTCRPSG